MRTRFILGALSPALALLLAACGTSAAANGGCPNPANSAPTISQGRVTIATDHGTYATTSAIQVTVTNNTGQPIYTYDHKASCSILSVEQQVNGQWVAPSKFVAGCALQTVTALIELAPGKPYTVSLRAGYLRTVAWPAGTYRLVLIYFTSRSDVAQAGGITVYSQPLTMVNCGVPTATGGSSAAPQVTAVPGQPITATPKP